MGQGIENYRAEGIEPYAVSPQNEPFFVQSFNSCWYKQEWYPEMLIGAMSILKANYPNVRIFGSEGMLEMEAADNNWQWFYHKQILDNPQARANIDILAVHGYSDGVAPTSGSTLGHLWQSHKQHFADPMNKKQWMTETSGYVDAWVGSPGAFALGLDIMSALNNGNVAGWVWWQGSENPGSTAGVGEFALMNGLTRARSTTCRSSSIATSARARCAWAPPARTTMCSSRRSNMPAPARTPSCSPIPRPARRP